RPPDPGPVLSQRIRRLPDLRPLPPPPRLARLAEEEVVSGDALHHGRLLSPRIRRWWTLPPPSGGRKGAPGPRNPAAPASTPGLSRAHRRDRRDLTRRPVGRAEDAAPRPGGDSTGSGKDPKTSSTGCGIPLTSQVEVGRTELEHRRCCESMPQG